MKWEHFCSNRWKTNNRCAENGLFFLATVPASPEIKRLSMFSLELILQNVFNTPFSLVNLLTLRIDNCLNII